ncbi:hypothetical protein SAMN06297129_3338 [Pseudooceanicola antarcticus]|uniref:Uncharacterized protein n=1 Tax=Pseudooceanicola antarcticus TaxID=1247613 RepID=A0A285JA47_9RHOB|nr:cache domain-containing protein [Pseudooceanicola antarcticus]PJE30811.1 hypothetical protein CVM39_05035 [Pseudooceanicola antarcticus]SNY57169.1 hypothetical protein SAMN06297129_3338 [Pseudooceanicola antarcticus]
MTALRSFLATSAIALSSLTLCFGTGAQANPYDASMRDYLEAEVLLWVFDPIVIEAIRDQNARHGTMPQAEIDALDQQWRAEVGTGDQPLVDAVLGHPASDFLRARSTESAGAISEIFLMDANGLNVAATGPTSDYWQGDEAKFQDTFSVGPGAVHVGDVEFDESTQAYLGQISVSVTDPDTREVIGAVTIGLNADMLY